SNPVGQTIMTTIHKFQDASDIYPVLTENPNVFVLVDEAHRTQYKTLAANMRQAVKNGTFIGFTGTPISKKYRSTRETFGDYVDIYDHKQAVKDGATVDIYYESRMPELFVKGNSINESFDMMFKDYSAKDRERIKKKYATSQGINATTTRVELVCKDIIKHFKEQIQPNHFKAQIVSCSRRAAIKYKQTLDKLNAPSSEILISKRHNDETDFAKYHKSKTQEQEVIRRFKEEKDPEIIIVCDKLITGFDAPVEQVMYLDSPLKEHTLLQAIARVNRVYKNKKYGLIVDYWGLSQNLQEALKMFTVEESEGMIYEYKKEILPRLQAAHNVAVRFFPEDYIKDKEKCVQFLEPEDRRTTFNNYFLNFSRYMDMLFPDPAAIHFVKDFKWLAEIRTKARNDYRDEQLSLKDCSDKVRQLIEKHIKAEGITHLMEPTSIFSEKFDEEIENILSEEAKASIIEHAIKHELTFKVHEDPVYYESLKERLDRIIGDFKDGRINAVNQLELLKGVLKDMRHPEKQAQKYGIEANVLPFYNIINESVESSSRKFVILENSAPYNSTKKLTALKDISKEIYSALDELTVVDWYLKEDVKREMRRKIKRILRSANYPADEIESKTLKILNLAKARFRQ
ncbi:MAG: type I restriction endonuclease subunit R, partial [Candidatus Aenigmarchaeota archaeon]|nr:type I restriction endonuclease subunit R [Candidatus Aenigmarchaeota archaeon]